MKNKKPNLIDVILILVLILVIAAAVYRTLSIKQLPDTVKDQKVEYTLEIYDIDSHYADAIRVGDTLYLSEKALYCGEVVSVQTSFAHREITSSDGTVSSHLYPAKINMTVKASLSADISENGFYIGDNTYLNLGKNMDMYTETFSFYALLADFDHIAE